MSKQIVLFILFALCSCCLHAQPVILKETFEKNTQNVTALSVKTLTSGEWSFYYTDKNYNTTTECAVLKYSGAKEGYISTPLLNKPSQISFSARTVGNVNNCLEIQKSVNGAAYATVAKVIIAGDVYKQYSVAINEINDNVKIRFLRKSKSSDGSNYNIILDNVQIFGTGPTLQVLNGRSQICNGQKICLPISADASSVEIPLTLTNTGNDVLEISDIKALGIGAIVGNTTSSLMPGNSLNIMVRITCTAQKATEVPILIHSNTSGCSPNLIRFEIKNNTDTD